MGSTRIGRVIAAMVGVAVIALTTVVPAAVAGAHGVVDQENEVWELCNENSVAQTFVPESDLLTAVDLLMTPYRAGTMELTIHDGGVNGATLATVEFELGTSDSHHIDLPEPVALVPGDTYALRTAPLTGRALICQALEDVYPAGTGYYCNAGGCSPTDFDLWFRTYTNSAPPDTTIDSGPADGTTESTAVFEFSGTDDVTPAGDLTFECSVDGGAFAACESGDEFGSFGVGPHTFAVRAIDGEGQVDPTPAEYAWRVEPADSGAPPGGPEPTSTTSTSTSTTIVPARVDARAATPTRAQPTFAG